MANKKALQLIELGLHPVLLGRDGDELKRPLLKGWQTAVYTPADVGGGAQHLFGQRLLSRLPSICSH